MGGCWYSWAGELTSGDFGGEPAVDFVDFLKNLDADLLGGGCCGGGGEERLEVVEEKKCKRVEETEGDCGESVSSWGIGCEK